MSSDIQGHYISPNKAFVEFKKEDIKRSIPDRFEQQVRRFPDNLAIKTKSHTLTYDELNRAVNCIANAISAQYGREEKPILLLFDQNSPMIIAILGVLKAEKILVLVDPSYPRAWIDSILDDSHAQLIVTDCYNYSLAKELANQKIKVINIDNIDSYFSSENISFSVSPDDIACILYTSGSTGHPKGIIQNHRNILHLIMRHTNSMQIHSDDRVSLLSTYSHIAGFTDIFRALLNGAALLLFHLKVEGIYNLAYWLIKEKVTVFHSVPTVFRSFVHNISREEKFPDLRLIHLGGEPVSIQDVKLYKKYFAPDCILLNNLGSTEISTFRQYFINKETQIASNIVPVGYAVKDIEILLLDETGEEVTNNNIGEIAVKSRYLSPGYWRRPDITKAKFLPDPKEGNERIYLTGDLGRMLPDGCLVHMGRKDDQVKIRGFRIEPGEIEAVLYQYHGVQEAIVIVREDSTGDKRLVAYIVPEEDSKPLTSVLRDFLKEKLPEYMIPSVFITLESMPLTPNGKVDRKALPAPDQERPELEKAYAAPCTPAEIKLAEIWGRLLKLKEVGVNDNFFELGGHSLLATQLISRIRNAFQVDLPLRIVFENSIIAEMALEIEQIKEKAGESEELGRLLDELEGLSDEEPQKRLTEN